MLVNSKNLIVCVLCLLVISPSSYAEKPIKNNRFEHIRQIVFTEPYSELPTYLVKRALFGKSGDNEQNKVLTAARRTLNDDRDLIDFPDGQKLLQANGICFAGEWRINHESDFTGLFKAGVTSPAIVRASVSLSGTLQKDKRAFGMAVKLFPDDLKDAPSLNAFVLHTMGGTVKKHLLDLTMDNNPPIGSLPKWSNISTALRLRKDLERADRDQGAEKPSVAFRPVHHLAEYKQRDSVTSPKWLRLSPATEIRIDENDFRDELRVENYPDNTLIYNIEVAADNNARKAKAVWQTIGELHLTQSVTSAACDKKLHFMHPAL